jgi:hypothetical protein
MHTTLVVPTSGGATTQSTRTLKHTSQDKAKCSHVPLLLLPVTWQWCFSGLFVEKSPKFRVVGVLGVSLWQQFVPPVARGVPWSFLLPALGLETPCKSK